MALKIRLQRHGAKGAPIFRMVVCEHTTRRDGKMIFYSLADENVRTILNALYEAFCEPQLAAAE